VTAEIGITGQGKNLFALAFGGSANGTRLNTNLLSKVQLEDLGPVISVVLDAWKDERQAGERLGDWADRVGVEALKSYVGRLPDWAVTI